VELGGGQALGLLPAVPGCCAAENGLADLDHALVSLPGPGTRRVKLRITTATAVVTDTVRPLPPGDRRYTRR